MIRVGAGFTGRQTIIEKSIKTLYHNPLTGEAGGARNFAWTAAHLRWETIGNAVMAHRTWRNWPYEQHFRVQADGRDILPGSIKVDEVEQQFDFRQISVSSPEVKIRRLDLMVSARQWITALQVTNPAKVSSKVNIEFDWTEKNKSHPDIRPWSDQEALPVRPDATPEWGKP